MHTIFTTSLFILIILVLILKGQFPVGMVKVHAK